MFLKQLYHYNKYGLTVFVLFIVVFLYLNIKWGLVATPVYQYGMFSGRYSVNDTQQVVHFYAGSDRVPVEKLHFSDRDLLFSMVEKYEAQKTQNISLYNTIDGIYARFGLKNFVKAGSYQNDVNDTTFSNWLRFFLYHKMNNSDIGSVRYDHQPYQWQQGKMKPLPIKK